MYNRRERGGGGARNKRAYSLSWGERGVRLKKPTKRLVNRLSKKKKSALQGGITAERLQLLTRFSEIRE